MPSTDRPLSRPGSDADDDERLRYAIALSLQEQGPASLSEQAGPPQTATGATHVSSGSFILMSLDRKKMEAERLARLGAKRLQPLADNRDDGDVVEVPPPKKKQKSVLEAAGTPSLVTPTTKIPYPAGTVKRTWARGYQRTGQDIKIEEVFQKDKLLLAMLSSFQWDEEWMLSKVDLGRTKLLLAAFAPNEQQKEEMRANSPPGVRFCFPPMNGFGSMHSKLQLLKYQDYLRIVVPTGNLVPYDWGESGVMENYQLVFIIDLPRLESAAPQEPTAFSLELKRFVQDMGVDNKMVDSLSNFDFSRTANLGFVSSRPGSHTDEALRGVGDDAVKAYNARLGRKPSDKRLGLPQELKNCFRIYFPTSTTAAGTICIQRKWWHSPDFPRDLVRDCVNTREGLLMHSKAIFVRRTKADENSDNNADQKTWSGWAYVGSANLSESAWGHMATDRKSGKCKVNLRNWECGVVIPVQGHGSQEGREQGAAVSMAIFRDVVSVPMRVPGRIYGPDDEPWFFDAT
ncbi:ubiquitin interaction domain-containing protein [Purpureocillium lavendulum]|uniref:Ubiquitin interaction domain-containing protein n=1 Tax=Purpureocillium lavendulum TaxID=1247861 RepID=A0AB34FQK7_9HYPO|nr:ubiquitin interaction domain-containing protein [Purpureocillium lavendulum]